MCIAVEGNENNEHVQKKNEELDDEKTEKKWATINSSNITIDSRHYEIATKNANEKSEEKKN